MFLTQVYGTILGAVINYAVMLVITTNKRCVVSFRLIMTISELRVNFQ